MRIVLFFLCLVYPGIRGEILKAVLGVWSEGPDVESDPISLTAQASDVQVTLPNPHATTSQPHSTGTHSPVTTFHPRVTGTLSHATTLHPHVTGTSHATTLHQHATGTSHATTLHPHVTVTHSTTPPQNCDDVAIIGGGIAGAYTAWRLRNTNQRISVYEYSDRIGGRLHTAHMTGIPDFNAELGGMRFHEASHQLLNKTIHDLGLTIKDFPLGYGASNDTLMFLRGVHMTYKELGGPKTPYRLGPQERKPYSQILWDVFVNSTDYLRHKNMDVFHLKTHDAIPLYKQSVQAVFAKYISTELARYIRDVNSFSSDFGTTSAAYALPASDPIIPGESMTNMKTVKEGMNEIPKRLLNEFKQSHLNHYIRTNHHLQAITKQHDGTYLLHFDKSRSHAVPNYCAKKVVLAINRLALEKLDWSVLKQPAIHNLITKAVRDARAMKFFLAYDHPWWKQSHYYNGFAISDTPIHRTYDFGTIPGTNVSVLDAVYTDNDISLWEELIERGPLVNGTAMHTVTSETISVIHKFLAAIYNIGVWNAYPIGGAWQEWLPGYIIPDVEKQMVKPSDNDEVYIASNAFNSRSLSFWAESSLEAAELVLKHFNV